MKPDKEVPWYLEEMRRHFKRIGFVPEKVDMPEEKCTRKHNCRCSYCERAGWGF